MEAGSEAAVRCTALTAAGVDGVVRGCPCSLPLLSLLPFPCQRLPSVQVASIAACILAL